MSAMSTRLIADYTELANKYLDKIPIKKIQDFQKITVALQALVKDNTAPTQLKNRLAPINELLNQPEDWVKAEDAEEFKSLIRSRIIAKVKEISSLNDEQKLAQINQQQSHREASSAMRNKLEEAAKKTCNKAPNILSEMECLAELQESIRRMDRQRFTSQSQNPRSTPAAYGRAESVRLLTHIINQMVTSFIPNYPELFSSLPSSGILFVPVRLSVNNFLNVDDLMEIQLEPTFQVDPTAQVEGQEQTTEPEYGPPTPPWMDPNWSNELD